MCLESRELLVFKIKGSRLSSRTVRSSWDWLLKRCLQTYTGSDSRLDQVFRVFRKRKFCSIARLWAQVLQICTPFSSVSKSSFAVLRALFSRLQIEFCSFAFSSFWDRVLQFTFEVLRYRKSLIFRKNGF